MEEKIMINLGTRYTMDFHIMNVSMKIWIMLPIFGFLYNIWCQEIHWTLINSGSNCANQLKALSNKKQTKLGQVSWLNKVVRQHSGKRILVPWDLRFNPHPWVYICQFIPHLLRILLWIQWPEYNIMCLKRAIGMEEEEGVEWTKQVNNESSSKQGLLFKGNHIACSS